ncbi:MAG: hypothetical protein OXH86_18550 [Acidimicrobiaceae bacterium]|nr:hypothetical protein [Acidimicrobiaceae bacterium]MDE0320365.1 hypothetical protein [Acidimicrobiaceae bacterium]MDE0499343.1 hypothetical protein [Acidimicrobiaceae bacterium]
MTDLPQRTFAEMIGLLEETDEVLAETAQPGVLYVLYVIGGVAMGALFDARMTQDVDVATAEIPPQVTKAASVVAQRHNIAGNWINNQAAGFIEAELPPSAFDPLFEGRCLLVRGASARVLLALKLMSGRGRDIADIIELADATGVRGRDALIALCDEVFADTGSYQFERDWIASVCTDIGSLLNRRRTGENIVDAVAALAADYDGAADPSIPGVSHATAHNQSSSASDSRMSTGR